MRNDERYNPKPQSGQLEIFGLAPSFARIMEARYPSLKDAFNKHRSQSDGFTA